MKLHLFDLTRQKTITGVSLLLLVAAGGFTWWIWQASVPTVPTQPIVSTQTEKTPQPEIYRLKVDNHRIVLVPQQVVLDHSMTSEQALMEGVINLLENPQMGNQSSAIPVGTHLLSLRMTPEEVHVNLSHEFEEGGGSTSMVYRVAQILYTVTSLNPDAKVYLAVEGQPLDEDHPLGGEGLVLKQPLTRQQFTKDFSLD